MTESGSTLRGVSSSEPRTPGPSRHDLVLGVVPVAFLVAFLLGRVFSVPPRVCLASGSLVGAVAIADGLFLNPPLSGGE